ncbi:hypothetical protein EKO04_002933 [Ascochyta lentis]|uniref:Uncharacterized protein n=1 Tax=Ascochyta lentis TaxID=205686 RepID=A0A8H7J672_9PLEO|nr:hypothetical protein EKO04_002933 [Ascochyta lentis]
MSSPTAQRDRVATALILLLRNLNPNLDVSHFAKHTPLKAEMKNSHDAATFIKLCAEEFNIPLTAPQAREEAQWALAGSAGAMHGAEVAGTGSAFAVADFVCAVLEREGRGYSGRRWRG